MSETVDKGMGSQFLKNNLDITQLKIRVTHSKSGCFQLFLFFYPNESPTTMKNFKTARSSSF